MQRTAGTGPEIAGIAVGRGADHRAQRQDEGVRGTPHKEQHLHHNAAREEYHDAVGGSEYATVGRDQISSQAQRHCKHAESAHATCASEEQAASANDDSDIATARPKAKENQWQRRPNLTISAIMRTGGDAQLEEPTAICYIVNLAYEKARPTTQKQNTTQGTQMEDVTREEIRTF